MDTDRKRLIDDIYDALGFSGRPRTKSDLDIKNYIASIGDLNFSDQRNLSPLAVPCIRGLPKVAEIMLKLGADPDFMGESKATLSRTALHYACEGGYLEIVKLLLQWGANPNLKDSIGLTPLAVIFISCVKPPIPIATELVNSGAQIEERAFEFGMEWNPDLFQNFCKDQKNHSL